MQGIDHFEDVGPCVVMASPGMMQSGLSRELFESWCTEPKNGVIIAGKRFSKSLQVRFLLTKSILICRQVIAWKVHWRNTYYPNRKT